MLKFADKTFVSYIGGSAGDMFTASINGIYLDTEKYGQNNYNTHAVLDIPFSIKEFERDIISNKKTLESVVSPLPWKYISTHLYNELPARKINIVISNAVVLEQVICRQMQIQRLHLIRNSGTIYNILISLINKEQYPQAATLWFDFSRKYALDKMSARLAAADTKLDFSSLFLPTFIDSLRGQGWDVNLDILYKNHTTWLAKQPTFSQEITINAIEQKLRNKNWTLINA